MFPHYTFTNHFVNAQQLGMFEIRMDTVQVLHITIHHQIPAAGNCTQSKDTVSQF